MNEMMNEYIENINHATLKEILAMNEMGYEFVVEDGAITWVKQP